MGRLGPFGFRQTSTHMYTGIPLGNFSSFPHFPFPLLSPSPPTLPFHLPFFLPSPPTLSPTFLFPYPSSSLPSPFSFLLPHFFIAFATLFSFCSILFIFLLKFSLLTLWSQKGIVLSTSSTLWVSESLP